MKNLFVLLVATLLLSGCLGNSSSDNELVGQVKKLQHMTPFIMPNYNMADLSMGVMKNGIGSVSKEDIWLYVPNEGDWAMLKMAAESGALIKVHYDVARFRLYFPHATITKVEILK